jgi:hypothetical protein
MGKAIGSIGDVGKTVGGVLFPAAGAVLGKGPVAKLLGLEKEQGEFYDPNADQTDEINRQNNYFLNGGQEAVNTYLQNGKISPSTLAREAVALDPMSGSKMAEDAVKDNTLLQGLFGKGALNQRLIGEEEDLAKNGFNLNQQDRTAYGQASGDIARQYAQQDTDITKQLARRGLASSGSGAAGAAFSGAAGNKYEQLAKMQTDIADKRYNANMERLNQTRSQINSLAGLGQQAQQAQFGRQLQGVQARRDYQTKGAALQQAANEQKDRSITDKRDSMGKSLLEGFGQGLFSGTQQMGSQAPQAAMKGATGGMF